MNLRADSSVQQWRKAKLGASRTGYDNVAVGRNSLDANVGGHSNTAVGESSLTSNTEGDRNIARRAFDDAASK